MSLLQRLTRPETSEHQELRLELTLDQAAEACRATIDELDWTLRSSSEQGMRLDVLEDFSKLSCGHAPMQLQIAISPGEGGRGAAVSIDATVPGVGGLSTNHVSDGMLVFVLKLARHAQRLGS